MLAEDKRAANCYDPKTRSNEIQEYVSNHNINFMMHNILIT